MAAVNGDEFLYRLRETQGEIWLDGERIRDVTTHPATRNGARSVAHLYDMQHEPELRDTLTYVSPISGERVGMSFLVPENAEDLRRRSRMMQVWARYSGGMMGRSPDY